MARSPEQAMEVLADLYEEVTGDPEKRWPVEWMAMEAVKATRNVGLRQAALDLHVEAGGDPIAVDFALYPFTSTAPIWVEVQKKQWYRMMCDITGNQYPRFEVRSRNRERDYTQFADEDPGGWWDLFTIYLEPLPEKDIRGFVNTELYMLGLHSTEDRERIATGFRSDDPWELLESYLTTGATLGFSIFDSAPKQLTDTQLKARWAAPAYGDRYAPT